MQRELIYVYTTHQNNRSLHTKKTKMTEILALLGSNIHGVIKIVLFLQELVRLLGHFY